MSKLGVFDLSVRSGKLVALNEVSFQVTEGARVFISGPNGAGKSSLLGAISGAVRAAHGRIEMDGDILSGRAPEAIARRGLSMVPEGRRLTLVIVEQSSTRAARVGGRMILMRGGRIVADGDAGAFAAEDLLTEAYFGQENAA